MALTASRGRFHSHTRRETTHGGVGERRRKHSGEAKRAGAARLVLRQRGAANKSNKPIVSPL